MWSSRSGGLKTNFDKFCPIFSHQSRQCKIWWIIPIFCPHLSAQSKFSLPLPLWLHTYLNFRDLLPTVAMISIPLWLLTQYIWYVWASSTDSGIEEQFPNTFLQSLNTPQQWQTDQLTHLLPQENINTTWSRPHYIQSVTSKTCLEYLIIPWWIKGKTFKTRLIDIYNCLDELYLEHLSVSKFKPNVTVRFY